MILVSKMFDISQQKYEIIRPVIHKLGDITVVVLSLCAGGIVYCVAS